MRRILTMLFLAMTFIAGNAYGQVAGLAFASTAGTYTEVTGGTQLATGTWDDATFSAVPLGFTFNANGTNFTTCVVSCNGYAYVSPTTTGSLGYGAISSTTAATEIFAPFSRDLQGMDATSTVRYETSGVAPNRIFTVQWKNAKRYGTSYVGEVLNIQLKLYETTNQAFFVYGAFTGSAYASAIEPQVGLRGLTNADFKNRTSTTSWAASTAGATNIATMTVSNVVYPASGQTYSFSMIPPVAATLVSPALASNCVDPTASLNWLPGVGGGPVAGFKLYYGTDNPPTNIVNGTNLGIVNTYNPTPDPALGQTLYWQVVPFNGAGDATGCPVWHFTVTTGFGNIQGFVTNAFGVPIAGAQVGVSGCSIPVPILSGPNGAYSFLNLSAGSYTVAGTATGYNTTTLTGIPIVAAQTTYQNIVLLSPSMSVTPNPYNVVINPNEMMAGDLVVNNNGNGVLGWAATINYGSTNHTWLSLASASGTVPAYTTANAGLIFDASGLTAGTVLTANIVFTSTPNVGTVTIPITMTVQGVALSPPTNLSGNLVNALTGDVMLAWSYTTSGSFINFTVKRDGVFLANTTATTLADVLPAYGVYNYTVSANYTEGSTAPASVSVEWANPTLTFTPASLYKQVYAPDGTGHQILTLNNTGLGLMSYSFPDYADHSGDAPLAYCAATATACDESISNVTFGTINNSSACSNYANYTALSTDLEQGVAMPITVSNPVPYSSDVVGVWCDWNHDQDFEDAGEFVQLGGGPSLFTGSVTPPLTALTGPTTMRVRIQWGGTLLPCGTTSYGEVEDYTVNVAMPSFIVSVSPPSGIVAAGGSALIDVMFSATGYAPGTYNDNLQLVTNDQANLNVSIPATMVVVVPATFAGTVTNGVTGDPIPGATITTTPGGFTTTTGDDGTYSMILDAGTYDLLFTKVGFQSYTATEETATAGSVATVDAQLYEDAIAPSVITAVVDALDTQCAINWSAPFGPYEMLYDDGSAENFAAWASAGNMNAVKFTPAGYPAEVQGGRVFVGDGSFPAGGNLIGQTFKMIVMQANGAAGMPGTAIDSVEVTANNYGWVDFSGLHATIASGDFYLTMVQGSAAPNCVPVGVDQTAPTAHKSYTRNVGAGGAWTVSPYQDLMIRAVVSGPVAGGDSPVASIVRTPGKVRGMISMSKPLALAGLEGNATLAAPAESTSDAAASYHLYRIFITDPTAPIPAPAPTDLIASPTATSYLESGTQWANLAQGWYAYAVEAVYPNGDVSPLTYSNLVKHKMLASVTVNVSLTTGGSPAGAVVTMTGSDYPFDFLTATVPVSGQVIFPLVIKGRYLLHAHLGGFTDVDMNVVINGDKVYDILLEELKYKPRNLYVDDMTLVATWDAPLSILADENFEGGVFPPDGWQNVYQSTSGWFASTDGGSAYFVIPPHTKYAVANDDAGGSSNNGCCDYLITPVYDLSGAPEYHLTFASYYDGGYGHSATVEMSTDGGSNWTVVNTLTPNPSGWANIDVDLTAYSGATGLSAVQFAFHSNDNGAYAAGWAVDDVVLSSGGIPVQGYAFFLDGTLVYQPIAETTYTLDPTTINYGQCYVAGVAGIYSSGFSELDTYNFCSHFLYPPRNLTATPNETAALLAWEAPISGDSHIDASYPAATTTAAPAEASATTSNFIPTTTGASNQTDAAVLYDNGTIVNSPGTGPGGSDESVIPAGGASYGFGMQQTAGYTVADDFVVPANWTINTVKFQGYQSNSGNTSTFTGLYFRIYDGDPAAGGNVVWGDLTTNLMTSTSFANIYRVNAPGEGTARPVMDIVCDGLTIALAPGTYWIEWQATGSGSSGPWVPNIVDPGNAQQFDGSAWVALVNPDAAGLPFVISGTGGGGGGGEPGGLISYNLYRDDAFIVNVPKTELQYFDLNLLPATYCYDVEAVYDLTSYGYPGLTGKSSKEGTACAQIAYGYYLPFIEDFTTGAFETSQWTAGQNWRIAGQMGDPMPSAEFGWDPPQTDYALSLESFYINSTKINAQPMDSSTSLYKIYFDFDLSLSDRSASSNEKLSAEVWNGSSWVKVAEFVNNGDIAFTTQHIDITSSAKNRVFKVRFLANGAASTDIYYWLVDNVNVHVEWTPALNLVSAILPANPTTVHLTWEAPAGATILPGEWIHYDDGVNSDGIGTGAAADFNVAIRFTPSQLGTYDGWAVKTIKFFPKEAACSYSVRVWTGANAANLVVDQPVAAPTIDAWNEITLTTPAMISASDELWIGVRCNTTTGYPAGCDAGPAVANYGDLITLDGILWESISAVYGLDFNWNIQGFVEGVGDAHVAALQPLQKTQPVTLATSAPKMDPKSTATTANLAQRTTSNVKESDNSRSIVGYNVYRESATPGYVLIGTTTATEYDDVDLAYDCYNYYVTVAYTEGESNPSNIRTECVTAIKDVTTSGVKIYPNPATTAVNVDLTSDVRNLTVYNYLGAVVNEMNIVKEKTVTLNTSNYAAGAYTIRFTTSTGDTFSKKLVIIK